MSTAAHLKDRAEQKIRSEFEQTCEKFAVKPTSTLLRKVATEALVAFDKGRDPNIPAITEAVLIGHLAKGCRCGAEDLALPGHKTDCPKWREW